MSGHLTHSSRCSYLNGPYGSAVRCYIASLAPSSPYLKPCINFTFKPEPIAAVICLSSDETNSSACHSSALATCIASNDRRIFSSSNIIVFSKTLGVILIISASTISSDTSNFNAKYVSLVIAFSLSFLLKADVTSGKQIMLKPSSDAF